METIRNEFKKNQFNFTHDKPEDFAVYSVSKIVDKKLLLNSFHYFFSITLY